MVDKHLNFHIFSTLFGHFSLPILFEILRLDCVLCSLKYIMYKVLASISIRCIKLYLMMPFSTGTGLERVGVVGPNLDCWRTGLQVPRSSGLKFECCNAGLQLWTWHSFARRTRKKGGQRGLRSWPLRFLSQFLSERKERLLRLFSIGVSLRMSLRTFHRWSGLYL